MAPDEFDIPVLIVGAGPVGLALACELGWRGVPCRVVEQSDGEVRFPAGEAIFARTMEHLRRWGIARQVLDSPFPRDYPRNVVFVTRLLGHEICRFERPSNLQAHEQAGRVSPEAHMWCPKMYFDPLLAAFARSHAGVRLDYGHELRGFEVEVDGVRAQVVEPDGRVSTVRARFLVGCDGGRSLTRRSLGIPLEGSFAEGHNYSIYFRAPQLLAQLPHGKASQYLTLASRYRSALSAVDGRELWRLSLYVEPHESSGLDPAGCIRDAFGAPIDVEILRAQPWAGHRVVVARYREGPVFLAGDAAHMLWPKGGFGANTGIGDAVDLGWKLAAVLQGWGGEALLESYERERRPVGLRNALEAASNRAADGQLPAGVELEDDSPQATERRARLRQQITTTRWKEWNTLGVQLGYRYADSLIVVPDGTPEPPDSPSDYQPSTWPGARAPHAWIAPGRSTLDAFGRGFVLVHDGADDIRAVLDEARHTGIPLSELVLADAHARTLYERRFVLVRPDGHVAWRGDTLKEHFPHILDRARGAVRQPASPTQETT